MVAGISINSCQGCQGQTLLVSLCIMCAVLHWKMTDAWKFLCSIYAQVYQGLLINNAMLGWYHDLIHRSDDNKRKRYWVDPEQHPSESDGLSLRHILWSLLRGHFSASENGSTFYLVPMPVLNVVSEMYEYSYEKTSLLVCCFTVLLSVYMVSEQCPRIRIDRSYLYEVDSETHKAA